MGVEKMIKYNNKRTRADIVLYNREGKPNMIVECKAPDVEITQDTFNQIAKYNFKLKVKFLVVTNGMKHFCCAMDYEMNTNCFLKEVPVF
jgi:type I site-specific restriction endonuclease